MYGGAAGCVTGCCSPIESWVPVGASPVNAVRGIGPPRGDGTVTVVIGEDITRVIDHDIEDHRQAQIVRGVHEVPQFGVSVRGVLAGPDRISTEARLDPSEV